eukprot:3710607-Prymnesium_polylepis.1
MAARSKADHTRSRCFCRAMLSEWAEEWLKALSEKGLKFSTLVRMCHMPVAAPTTPLHATAVRPQTLKPHPPPPSQANYCNGLCMVGQFVYQTYAIDSDALAMPKSPLDELLNLRAQCESQ